LGGGFVNQANPGRRGDHNEKVLTGDERDRFLGGGRSGRRCGYPGQGAGLPAASAGLRAVWRVLARGWAKYDHQWSDKDAWAGAVDDDLVGDRRNSKGGGAGGIGGGYNWQSGCTVFGVSIDYNWASLNASNTYTDGELAAPFDTLTVSSKLRAFGTAQFRTGIVVDNLLLYVTGGLAFARFNREWTLFDDDNLLTETFSQSRTRWGGVVGVGTEWAFNTNWSIKSEFLYMAFERDETSFGSTIHIPGVNQRFESQDSVWVSRIGLTYRFGGLGKFPVAAKY
jgi:outer membrane immunogenic protein